MATLADRPAATALTGAESLPVRQGAADAKTTTQAIADLAKPTFPIGIAASDETTALTTGAAKATFRMPFAYTLASVRASVTTAPTGAAITVNVKKNGVTVFSTKVTIDANQKSSIASATQSVLSTTSLADNDEITVDIDTVGSTVAGAGLKVWLIGKRT